VLVPGIDYLLQVIYDQLFRLTDDVIRKAGLLRLEVDDPATARQEHDIGGQVRSAPRNASLRIADAFIHIEPAQGP
jgi:hypothetical protein